MGIIIFINLRMVTIYDAWNPAKYWIDFHRTNLDTYTYWFELDQTLADWKIPMPIFDLTTKKDYLEKWSSMFDSSYYQLLAWFILSTSIPMCYLAVFFAFRLLNANGFAGFEYNKHPYNTGKYP